MPKLTASQNANRINDDVQSVLISKQYSKEDIPDIMDLIGYNFNYIDKAKNYWRIRQFNPGSFRSNPRYKTASSKTFSGIKYVIEY